MVSKKYSLVMIPEFLEILKKVQNETFFGVIFKLECENILRYCIHCLVAVLASVVVRCAVVSSSGVMAFVMVWVALLLLQYGATEVEDLLPNLQFYSTPRPFPSRRETSLKCRENKRNLCQQVKVFLHYIHKRKMNILGKLQNGNFISLCWSSKFGLTG